MDRRESLKSIALGTLSAGLLLEACNPKTKKAGANGENGNAESGQDNTGSDAWAGKFESWEESSGRQPFEVDRDKKLMAEKFFNDHEMKTIAVLADIIIPADDKSGSATDAGVPDFIEFIVKDMPENQTPMRGGLRWLDMECLNRHDNVFTDCSQPQQLAIVDDIAYPAEVKPELQQGASFFNLMRNLTASGFFSSKMGIKDIGYAGNTPNIWDGVPEDVQKQYNMFYTSKQLAECVKKEDHNKMFVFPA
ncbi:MAG: gluconate 2-dehydrogenase subunit 3 family protein [Chitinophagaceae bacterium]